MDQDSTSRRFHTTPLFDAFRRGYDPEQVDSYLGDQQKILDATTRRADEAEQRLGTAIMQLRSMNARIADLEKNQSSSHQATATPSVPIDILGDRVQRILQEAWDGAFALRQNVETEVTQLREQALSEAQSIVEEARQKARSIEEQMRKRRDAYIQRVEQDKERAVTQMTFLSDQRKAAVAELLNIKENIEAAIVDVPTHTAANLSLVNFPVQSAQNRHEERRSNAKLTPAEEAMLDQHMAGHPSREPKIMHFGEVELPPTLPVQMITTQDQVARPADTSNLVRRHRESAEVDSQSPADDSQAPEARIFDFEAERDQ
jgi:cell division septum initiation protein DivIVA